MLHLPFPGFYKFCMQKLLAGKVTHFILMVEIFFSLPFPKTVEKLDQSNFHCIMSPTTRALQAYSLAQAGCSQPHESISSNLDLSHTRGEQAACDVSLHLSLALLALGLLAAASVHGPRKAHLPASSPVHQRVVDERLQQGEQGLTASAHHLDHLRHMKDRQRH